VTTRARILWALALASALGYLVSLLAVVLVGRQDQRPPADAIVVLGAAQYNGKPSPVLRARLDHALELYRTGVAPVVVVTGGIGPGDRVSEATVGRQYLVEHQVPETAVVVRPEGRSTEASIRSVAQWLRDRGGHRVVMVSDPFHLLRLRLEARSAGITGYTSPTSTSPISMRLETEFPYLLSEALKIPAVLLLHLGSPAKPSHSPSAAGAPLPR
jgi:uncharacterized SAM-binding protein YcdF (DUF218 family)